MKPRISYVICAVQRSGSFLLCEALKNTGLAGNPEEYFLESEGWEYGEWARGHGVRSRTDYLHLVFEHGTTPNGVFGTKIMWNYFSRTLEKLQELPDYRGMQPCQVMAALFPNLHYIWIVRHDKVRQAVSWAKAGQTGIYAWHKGKTPVPEKDPTFDFTFIDNLYKLVLEGEAGWQSFFDECGVQPFKVVYEDLVEAYEQTAIRILEYLDIPFPKDLAFGERQLQKQADALNEAWAAEYMRRKQQIE